MTMQPGYSNIHRWTREKMVTFVINYMTVEPGYSDFGKALVSTIPLYKLTLSPRNLLGSYRRGEKS